jgi:hypothetical protein
MGAPLKYWSIVEKNAFLLECGELSPLWPPAARHPTRAARPGHPQDAAVLTPIQATGREQPER